MQTCVSILSITNLKRCSQVKQLPIPMGESSWPWHSLFRKDIEISSKAFMVVGCSSFFSVTHCSCCRTNTKTLRNWLKLRGAGSLFFQDDIIFPERVFSTYRFLYQIWTNDCRQHAFYVDVYYRKNNRHL